MLLAWSEEIKKLSGRILVRPRSNSATHLESKTIRETSRYASSCGASSWPPPYGERFPWLWLEGPEARLGRRYRKRCHFLRYFRCIQQCCCSRCCSIAVRCLWARNRFKPAERAVSLTKSNDHVAKKMKNKQHQDTTIGDFP